MDNIIYHPIGIVHSPFMVPEGTPIQSVAGNNVEAVIEIYPEFVEGLLDLEHFSHIYVLYHLHLACSKSLRVIPFLDTVSHGIFATRSPGRPNPIGISIVSLDRREGNLLHIRNIDILDGTPVLDIKPYVTQFDSVVTAKNGWLDKNVHRMRQVKDDGRFK
jgi:tRNA-Thr(GGU) m(6)t(6)A37 methyltransferase TsaA